MKHYSFSRIANKPRANCLFPCKYFFNINALLSRLNRERNAQGETRLNAAVVKHLMRVDAFRLSALTRGFTPTASTRSFIGLNI